jgi:hypothetical protein
MAVQVARVSPLACRRLRLALVDLADGTLAPAEARRVEAHVAICATCRGDLAIMRGLTTGLRDPSLPEPPEDFWRQQRQAIMRQVRQVPEPAATRAPWWRWQLAGAIATAALAVVVTRTVFLPGPPGVSRAIERLDDDALFHLHDLMPVLVTASSIEDADADELSVHDLGDDELDSLSEQLDPAS